MPAETLRRWATVGSGNALALIPIEVVADTERASIESPHVGVRITTRAGHRIEGLSVADAIAIARVLG
jgi:hypothetical protein